MLNNSTFEGRLETTLSSGLNACEICGREIVESEVCSGCRQWVEHYAEMLPLSREMSVDLQ